MTTAKIFCCVFFYLLQVALLLDIEWGPRPRAIVAAGGGSLTFDWQPPENRGQLWWKWLWPFVIALVPLWAIWVFVSIYAGEKVRGHGPRATSDGSAAT
ncbi:MAG: hypothetical protein PHU85_16960 [Phycisphaerae bacterium]|nr:hypothetical protein [Phycisphaerae bacterium]